MAINLMVVSAMFDVWTCKIRHIMSRGSKYVFFSSQNEFYDVRGDKLDQIPATRTQIGVSLMGFRSDFSMEMTI